MDRYLLIGLLLAISSSPSTEQHINNSQEESADSQPYFSIPTSYDQHSEADDSTELGICQPYTGRICEKYMRNYTVFITPDTTMEALEEKLARAYGVIKQSKDMNAICAKYAVPSLCITVLPICRTPEETNHYFFLNRNRSRGGGGVGGSGNGADKSETATKKAKKNNSSQQQPKKTKAKPTTMRPSTRATPPRTTTTFSPDVETHSYRDHEFSGGSNSYYEELPPNRRRRRNIQDFMNIKNSYPPTKNTENLRRICRQDCELLENEICQKEYAIAKQHPTIGKILPLEDCSDVPNDDEDCLRMGINTEVDPKDSCFWENGNTYRGMMDRTINGKPCLKWSKVLREITHIELANNNYCRNPDSSQPKPWCYVDKQKTVELCDVAKCSDQLWLLVICALIIFLSTTMFVVLLVCCRKMKRQSVSNIQNIPVPNVDKNIYGNSRHSSPIEMTSLLATNGIVNTQHPTNARGNIMKICQYSLKDVRFLEELGEGAFGKVYKGNLTQKNGDQVFVAVKALKENASPKTQTDFRREIELISDLKHQNIVCILGVVLKEEPLCMLFEYMSHGDLHEYLISNSPNEGKYLNQQQFLFISLQIAEGMEYLSSHHYVHRDLAARNCLVGDDLIVKISDFGLSRDIYSSDYYRVQSKSLLPVRWMPSEAILYGKFTTESDVWSYGVVLWEIYSYGIQPYFGYSNQEVINMIRARQLLASPEACPSAIYSLMVECWHEQSVRRPTFPEIVHRLKVWYQSQRRRDQMEFNGGSINRQQMQTPTTGSTISVRSFK